MQRFLLICVAGALGTGARYAIQTWAARAFGPAFPYGTLLVNVSGSFAMSALMQLALATELVPTTARLALAAGFLGGFTTYSSFNYETLSLVEHGFWGRALLNAGLTLFVCAGAGALGLGLGRWLVASLS
ncbi:MAG TPA: CrcB family protein [Polyangiaceae bacterium]|nr:CrcB family protein [Polyangiaceae bacterium]